MVKNRVMRLLYRKFKSLPKNHLRTINVVTACRTWACGLVMFATGCWNAPKSLANFSGMGNEMDTG
jgi:hypothetical protein